MENNDGNNKSDDKNDNISNVVMTYPGQFYIIDNTILNIINTPIYVQ